MGIVRCLYNFLVGFEFLILVINVADLSENLGQFFIAKDLFKKNRIYLIKNVVIVNYLVIIKIEHSVFYYNLRILSLIYRI